MMYLKIDNNELIPIESFYSQTGAFTPAPKGLYIDIYFSPTKNFINNIYPILQNMAYDFGAFHSIEILSHVDANDRKILDPQTIEINPKIGPYVTLLSEKLVKVFTFSTSSQGPANMEGQKVFYKITFISPVDKEE